MARKKSGLWLSKPKRSRRSRASIIISAWGETDSKKRLHFLTPVKISTPKRPRLFSPGTPIFIDLHCSPDLSQSPTFGSTVRKSQEKEKTYQLFDTVSEKLKQHGLENDFVVFLELVAQDKFPIDNMSFRLFLETVRFFSLQSTSEMKYSDVTKRFWKTGYRLFHGKFLYFMGGPKNFGQLRTSESGLYSPDSSLINFAVPSICTLSNFNIGDVDIPKAIPPGILTPVISSLQATNEREFMLCADGKKVTAGVDDKGGDVDLFTFEDGVRFDHRKRDLQLQTDHLQSVVDVLKTNPEQETLQSLDTVLREELKVKMKTAVKVLGTRMKDCRELACRQRMGMDKFKTMAGEQWKESRYVYVISGLQASLYQIKEFVADALLVIDNCMKHTSQLEQSYGDYSRNRSVDASYQRNMLCLGDMANRETVVEIEPKHIKQRSDIWLELRKKARATGSTLHSAIGLRGLKHQKRHYRQFIENYEETFEPEILQRMEYGAKHESDAIATIVGRILPTFFPESSYIEEGCYVLSGKQTDVLGVVSPDGSIGTIHRNNTGEIETINKTCAIEIKCPYPSKDRLPVHYSMPEYYVCQCLAEMHVLETNKLLYISHSEESTTVFNVQFDSELWNEIWGEIVAIYDVENLKIPTKVRRQTQQIRQKIKEFVQNKVELVCEVPSLRMMDTGLRSIVDGSPYTEALRTPHFSEDVSKVEDVVTIMEKSKDIIEKGYNLLRRRASEVMVWVLTNKNRNSTSEIPCSLPVAYGLKDYKLTTKAMRSATNYVLEKCTESGLTILSVSSDGQWIQMMSRDSDDKPLTLYQLVKDVWKETQSLSKQELVRRIGMVNCNLSNNPTSHLEVRKLSVGAIEVSHKNGSVTAISTPWKKQAWVKGSKKTRNAEAVTKDNQETSQAQTIWLPDSVTEQMPHNQEHLVGEILSISSEVMAMDFGNDSIQNEFAYETGNDIQQSYLQESLIHPPVGSSDEAIEMLPELPNTDAGEVLLDGREVRDIVAAGETQPVKLSRIFLGKILNDLQTNACTRNKWEHIDEEELRNKLKSKESIFAFRHVDLNTVYDSAKDRLPTEMQLYRKSWKKEDKANFICGILGISPINVGQAKTSRKKPKSPWSLKRLVLQSIQRKSYPKMVLRSAYAQHLFPKRLSEWQNEAPFSSPTAIGGLDENIPFWFSYPERSKSTGKLLCKSLDCSHNLTHMRVRTCTTNMCGLNPEAWKACAKSGETALSVPLVEDVIDKQSVPNARTHFSPEVEQWMFEHDYKHEASFIRLVRDWYDASDSPGISAIKRIQKLLALRTFILKDIDFSSFPPNTQYFKGIPCVTFEGMLIDIDTKLQMYAMTSSYNIRSVGSLAAETTVGVLQALYPNPQVSIKARDVPGLISSAVEIMTCKSNPNRGFHMRTSRSSGVYPDREGDLPGDNADVTMTTLSPRSPLCITPRDHEFDMPQRKKSRRCIKFGGISGPQAPSRGALPVRQYHRKDESKILPTKRLGIDMED